VNADRSLCRGFRIVCAMRNDTSAVTPGMRSTARQPATGNNPPASAVSSTVLSFEPELHTLRPLLGEATTNTLIARERREVFSVHPELRIVAWGGAMLLATAAGLVLKNNLDRIGPLALAVLIGAAAVACYAFVWLRRAKPSLVHDYILLLGALLVSADVAFVESQFHLFGPNWYRHFLLLAILHGAGAYLYRSRTLLTLALAAMAAWLGVTGSFPDSGPEYAWRAFAASAIALMGRALDARYRPASEFTSVYEHFAANLAAVATIALMLERDTRLLGCFLGLIVAAAIIGWGLRTRRELFVIYGFLYALLAADVLLIHLVPDDGFAFLIVIVSTIGAIAALFVIHARFREVTA
jgi:hypothetical protein